jgi:hypothetical protein
MKPFKPTPESVPGIEAEDLDRCFSPQHQQEYVSALLERGGLTRRRAECFVRLWAYLLLKQQGRSPTSPQPPLSELHPTEALVSCTHREAADLFYGNQNRGSDRAAGMMIDQLVALGLLEKRFDGQTLCLRIRPLPELKVSAKPPAPIVLKPDSFNPRTDAIPVAGLIRQTYAMAYVQAESTPASPQRIARILRQWSQDYPSCLRVLRRCDNLNAVGVAILYPTSQESEDVFSRPPNKSFYLTSNLNDDPVKMAPLGDPDCLSIYVRAWIIDPAFLQHRYICEFLNDMQQTLTQMHGDFPNLCDLYSPVIHPLYEELRIALGFQKTCDDRPFYWAYLSLDRFLALDIEQALVNFKLAHNPET